MENNYIQSTENEINEPSLKCISAILAYSKTVDSFVYNGIRFKLNLN